MISWTKTYRWELLDFRRGVAAAKAFCESYGAAYVTEKAQFHWREDDRAKIESALHFPIWIEHGDFSFASWRMLLEAKPGDTLELKIRQRAFASCPT